MSDQAATVLPFPIDRARQAAEDALDQVDAQLADVLRPFGLRVLPGGRDTDEGPRAA